MNKFGIDIYKTERIIIFEFDTNDVEYLDAYYEMSEGQLINKWNYISDFQYNSFMVGHRDIFNTFEEARRGVIKELLK